MGKSWDTKKVNEFIEYFEHAANQYMECLTDIHVSYESYRNNDTFVGGGAEQSKAFIGMKQEEYNRLQYELSKEMVKRYADLDETFKTMVDPAPDARIDTDVVKTTKSHFVEQLEEFESVAFAIQNKSMEAEERFKKYCGDIEEVYVRDAVMNYDEFCNTGGFLDDCIKKVEEFDSEASNRLNRSGLKNAINEHIAEMMVKTNELDSIQVHTQSVSKQTLVLAAFGSVLGVKGVQDAVNERKALDAKVDKWLSPNYKLSPEEIKEANKVISQELGRFEYDFKHHPVLRTKEEKALYKKYMNLASKCSKFGCFITCMTKPFYNMFDFAADGAEFVIKHTVGAAVENGANLIDHYFGTDTAKYVNLFKMSYVGAREDAEKELYIAVDNARTQNLKESTAGEAAGILCLYYMTSEISAALEAGKDIGFIAKQTKENIQDLAIDTRNLYQELARDGELSKSDWGFLGRNVAENFFTNLILGELGEVVDILKPSKELHLKKVEKAAEEAENVKKIEKTAEGASKATKVAGDTAEDVTKVVGESTTKRAEKSGVNSLLPREGNVGTYKELSKSGVRGDNLTPHHMPSDKYMSQYGIKRGDGMCMNMEMPSPGTGGRHRLTATYGGNMTSVEKTEYMAMKPRDALTHDLKNIKKIYSDANAYPEIKPKIKEFIEKSISEFPELFEK